jgi:hypothetical protein
VAFLIFPARASLTAAVALDKYLAALGDLVAAARRRAHRGNQPVAPPAARPEAAVAASAA